MIAAHVARLALVGLAFLPGCDEQVAGSGRLVVDKSLASGPIFIEGSVTHLRLVRDDGTTLTDGLRPTETLDEPLLDQAVPAGSYTLETVERPCQGNCDFLDPPAEATRCTLPVQVLSDKSTRVTVVLDLSAGDVRCRVTAASPDRA
jgi:hypothetical protein